MIKKEAFECQLFTWDNWDEIEMGCLQFNNCKLIKKFHQFKKDAKFDYICIDLSHSIIEFTKKEKSHKFKMILDQSTTTMEIK